MADDKPVAQCGRCRVYVSPEVAPTALTRDPRTGRPECVNRRACNRRLAIADALDRISRRPRLIAA